MQRPTRSLLWRTTIALGLALPLTTASVAAAGAAPSGPEPAPGNLVANPGFDAGTAGWGSWGGTVERVEPGYDPCEAGGSGAARVTALADGPFTLSDTEGGNRATVPSTVAGDTYIAYARVGAATPEAVGRQARLVLRERTPAGAVVRETATAFTLGEGLPEIVVSATAVGSGNSLGLRVSAVGLAGDAFLVDEVYVRRAAPAFGSTTPGTSWLRLGGDTTRVSRVSEHDEISRYVDRVRVYLDGKGATSGSQRLRAVVYTTYGPDSDPAAILATSQEVVVRAGAAGRWVDLRFPEPAYLSGYDTSTFFIGLQSGPTRNVARVATTVVPGGLLTSADAYADGPNVDFGVGPAGGDARWTTESRLLSVHAIAAPIGYGGYFSC